VKADKIAVQAGQVVESIVDSYLKALDGRSGRRRGPLRSLFGLAALAGGGAALFYAQADEQQREEASRKLSELADQVRGHVSGLTG